MYFLYKYTNYKICFLEKKNYKNDILKTWQKINKKSFYVTSTDKKTFKKKGSSPPRLIFYRLIF